MTRTTRILPRAERDAQEIFDWLKSRSLDGALSWWAALQEADQAVARNAEAYSVAPENEFLAMEIRQKIFKTSKGRNYRIVYTIRGDVVFILRVRGPGQPPLAADELNW